MTGKDFEQKRGDYWTQVRTETFDVHEEVEEDKLLMKADKIWQEHHRGKKIPLKKLFNIHRDIFELRELET